MITVKSGIGSFVSYVSTTQLHLSIYIVSVLRTRTLDRNIFQC